MSLEYAHEYRQRWQKLAELERAEQQAASVAQRWPQLSAILSFGRHLPFASPVAETPEADTWQRLREMYEQARRT